MNLSRRQLYAHGEPIGDSATQRKPGGGYRCGGGGGGGSSSSASTQTTTNTDARVVGGANSANVSASGSTVTINTTDAGAVHDAFGFAAHVSDNAINLASASQIQTTQAVQQSMAQVADAYSTAKAGEQKIFAGAALAVVGVVAAIALKH